MAFILGQDISEKCILHKGAISSGYGHVWNGKKVVTAHRLAYEKAKGIIGKGLEIHHLCHNRLCINPDHLTALTKKDHRLIHLPERVGFNNSLKTNCLRGHSLDGRNKQGRFCTICKKRRQNEYASKNREKTNLASYLWKQKNIDKHRKYNREYMRKKRMEAKYVIG